MYHSIWKNSCIYSQNGSLTFQMTTLQQSQYLRSTEYVLKLTLSRLIIIFLDYIHSQASLSHQCIPIFIFLKINHVHYNRLFIQHFVEKKVQKVKLWLHVRQQNLSHFSYIFKIHHFLPEQTTEDKIITSHW